MTGARSCPLLWIQVFIYSLVDLYVVTCEICSAVAAAGRSTVASLSRATREEQRPTASAISMEQQRVVKNEPRDFDNEERPSTSVSSMPTIPFVLTTHNVVGAGQVG